MTSHARSTPCPASEVCFLLLRQQEGTHPLQVLRRQRGHHMAPPMRHHHRSIKALNQLQAGSTRGTDQGP